MKCHVSSIFYYTWGADKLKFSAEYHICTLKATSFSSSEGWSDTGLNPAHLSNQVKLNQHEFSTFFSFLFTIYFPLALTSLQLKEGEDKYPGCRSIGWECSKQSIPLCNKNRTGGGGTGWSWEVPSNPNHPLILQISPPIQPKLNSL